ncbi:hypothetical protein QYE76_032444 [Lolium multiflorum]|uniref:Uncharacterized protein n=1 Tax=Lolium multiflorum TaxID=4521 RepID=A0AAD8QV41_LOLMU|nr:hypothetical protein QYE76_032444 [Lolium multiflorum]
MSKGKRLLKMTPSSGVGVGSRYTMTLSLRLNQVLAEEIMMPTTLPRLLLPRRAQQASSQAKMTLTFDAVVEFAEEFTRLEIENSQLRKTVRSSADQVLEANRLATDAKNENVLLKEEVKKLKQRLKDEQDAKRAAVIVKGRRSSRVHQGFIRCADLTVTVVLD